MGFATTSSKVFLLLLLVSTLSLPSLTESMNNWCPGAKCNDFGECEPCNKKFLFIIAQSRSGGTTLKNMLNLLPGVRISGEVGIALGKMVDLWSYLRVGTDKNLQRGRGKFEGPWGHYAYPEAYLACPAQDLIESINPPKDIIHNISNANTDLETILGFKEVRINNKHHLGFLLKFFPCSRFIFNIKSDVKALKVSQDRANLPTHLLNKNQAKRKLWDWLRSTLPNADSRTYLMDIDEWSKEDGTKKFNDLAKWLGYEDCEYPKVLHDNHAVDDVLGTMDKDRFELGSSCRRTF